MTEAFSKRRCKYKTYIISTVLLVWERMCVINFALPSPHETYSIWRLKNAHRSFNPASLYKRKIQATV